MNLNVGGFFGAVAGLALAGLAYFLLAGGEFHYHRGTAKLLVLAVVLGAGAGNAVWGWVFAPPAEPIRPDYGLPAEKRDPFA